MLEGFAERLAQAEPFQLIRRRYLSNLRLYALQQTHPRMRLHALRGNVIHLLRSPGIGLVRYGHHARWRRLRTRICAWISGLRCSGLGRGGERCGRLCTARGAYWSAATLAELVLRIGCFSTAGTKHSDLLEWGSGVLKKLAPHSP